MILKSSILSQSITLRTVTTDKFKTGTLSFSVRIPNQKLTSPYSLLLCEVLRRSTAHYPTKAALSRRLDELYSASVGLRCIGQGDNKLFSFSAEMLDDQYASEGEHIADGVCDILADIMLSPLLDENELFGEVATEQEKRRVISYLNSMINNPSRYASLRLLDLARRDDRDHLTLKGMIEAVSDCDSKRLTEFYKENIACRPIDIFYIGTLSHEEVKKMILSRMGEYTATKFEAVVPLESPYPKREVCRTDESMPINQGRLAIAFRSDICIGNEDFYAFALANEIFGGSPASKLFMNVREKMSLCYSCSSSYNMGTGAITVSSGIDQKNREVAETAILTEFENIQKGKISEKEFNAAQKAVENSYREIYDNPYAIFSYYNNRLSVGIETTIEECRQKFSAVKLDDVIKAANRAELDSVYFLCGSGDGGEYCEEDDDE